MLFRSQIIKAAKAGKIRYNIASLPDFTEFAQMEEAVRKLAAGLVSEALKKKKKCSK